MRTKYNEIVTSPKILCLNWRLSIEPKIKRKVFTKNHYGDMDSDKRLDINEDNFRVTVFLPVIDLYI